MKRKAKRHTTTAFLFLFVSKCFVNGFVERLLRTYITGHQCAICHRQQFNTFSTLNKSAGEATEVNAAIRRLVGRTSVLPTDKGKPTSLANFGSRLMQNLRGEHGYTYGVGAAMVNFEREGYLGIAAQVGAEVTAPALREIYNEIERLRREPMPEEELALVKNMMTGEMMRILDGPFGIADVTIENLLCGTNNGVIEENIRRIQAITPAEVQRLAVKYLRREDLITAVVGAVDPFTKL